MDYTNHPPCFPMAYARIVGDPLAPELCGIVRFFQTPCGVWVEADVHNLPPNPTGFYGFHIHEFGDCSMGSRDGYFKAAGGHYNPTNQLHPLHAGDLPMLIATSTGNARLNFLTDRFTVNDIVGRAVIIHYDYDNYTSQPSGDSGARIGCGIITTME